MILTVVVGNTNTRLAWFEGGRLVRRGVVRTRGLVTALSRAPSLPPLAVASVVPALVPEICRLAPATWTFVLDRSSRTGLKFRYARNQVGADRVCVAVGARALYRGNLLVIDFGTAVTINVLTSKDEFLGGPILPGPELMLRSLSQGTARLPSVSMSRPARVLPKDTRSALRSGAYHLLTAGIRNMVGSIESELGHKVMLLATGGGARLLAPGVPAIRYVEPDLASLGLYKLALLNRPDWFK